MSRYEYILRGFSAKIPPKILENLHKDPRVREVVKNTRGPVAQGFNFLFKTRDSAAMLSNFQSVPWGVQRVGGPLTGNGLYAWILDSGIDFNHSDLNVDSFRSRNFVNGEPDEDLHGHGTHIAGIIASTGNNTSVVGVASGATVVSVKVINKDLVGSIDAGLDGIEYVATRAHNTDVVNMSLCYHQSIHGDSRKLIDEAVENAADTGVRFAVSAGNNASHANICSPARVVHDNVWTISSIDSNDYFFTIESNYGNPPIDYAAPGVSIYSLWKDGGTNTLTGTSMAAPHFAGLLLAVPDDIKVDGYAINDPDGNPDPIAAFIPLKVSINGPVSLETNQIGTWTADVINPEGTVNYQWYYTDSSTTSWLPDGTNSDTYSRSFSQPSQSATDQGIRVIVTDNLDQVEDIRYVTVVQEDCTDPTLPCP